MLLTRPDHSSNSLVSNKAKLQGSPIFFFSSDPAKTQLPGVGLTQYGCECGTHTRFSQLTLGALTTSMTKNFNR